MRYLKIITLIYINKSVVEMKIIEPREEGDETLDERSWGSLLRPMVVCIYCCAPALAPLTYEQTLAPLCVT